MVEERIDNRGEKEYQKIRDKRKEQIMNAALKVFARRGFVGAKTK
jgi:hypothetical protein